MLPISVPMLAIRFLLPVHDAIDRAWGPLVQSRHERGSWTARVEGRLISGDWKITSTKRAYNPLAHLASEQTWVHYVDTLGNGYCAVALEEPGTMYCQLKPCDQLWNCAATRAPRSLQENGFAVVEPSLAQELSFFERLHKQDLGKHLGVVFDRKATGPFTVKLPYRIEVAGSKKHWSKQQPGSHFGESGFDRELAGFEAEITFGPRAKDHAIKAVHSTGQLTERCTYPAHAATSCMPAQPVCEIL